MATYYGPSMVAGALSKAIGDTFSGAIAGEEGVEKIRARQAQEAMSREHLGLARDQFGFQQSEAARQAKQWEAGHELQRGQLGMAQAEEQRKAAAHPLQQQQLEAQLRMLQPARQVRRPDGTIELHMPDGTMKYVYDTPEMRQQAQAEWSQLSPDDPLFRNRLKLWVGKYPHYFSPGAVTELLKGQTWHKNNLNDVVQHMSGGRYMSLAEVPPSDAKFRSTVIAEYNRIYNPLLEEKRRAYEPRTQEAWARLHELQLHPEYRLYTGQFRRFGAELTMLQQVERSLQTSQLMSLPPPINPATGTPWTQEAISARIAQLFQQLDALQSQMTGQVKATMPQPGKPGSVVPAPAAQVPVEAPAAVDPVNEFYSKYGIAPPQGRAR
jgi:hypothetical protein